MAFILPALSVAPPIKSIGPAPGPVLPSWVPTIGGVTPVLFADLTTEGGAGNFWYNPTQGTNYPAYVYGSLEALLVKVDGTFLRAGSAFYINSSGLLTSAASNIARFDYDPIALTLKGLLLEGSATNLCLQSNTFNNASWTAAAGSLTDFTQNATGPDGAANSAWTLTISNSVELFFPTVTVSGQSTVSMSVKAGTASNFYFEFVDSGGQKISFFNASTGAWGTTNSTFSGAPVNNQSNFVATALPSGWYRISLTNSATVTTFQIGVSDADNSRSVTVGHTAFWYGAQIETGSFATSYITTTNATVARAADNFSVPWTATTFTAAVKQTLAAEVDGNALLDAGNGLITQAAGPLAQTSNGTNNITTSVNAFTSSNAIVVGGTPSARVLSANGNNANNDAHALVPSAPTIVQIGANTSDANNSNGDYAKFGLWSVAATGAQAATLSGAL